MPTPFQPWLDQALRQIRYRPDRPAIKAELLAHMEDRLEDFRTTLPDPAAHQAVLQAMGDPTQTGKQLNRAHSPWLGYALLLTRILSLFLVILCVWSLLSGSAKLEAAKRFWYEDDTCAISGTAIQTGLRMAQDPYTLEVHHGVLSDTRWIICLEAWSLRPWQLPPEGLRSMIVEDPTGRQIPMNIHHTSGDPDFFAAILSTEAWSFPRWKYHLVLEFTPWSQPYEPEWLRFHVPDTQIDFTVWSNGEVRRTV